MSAEKKTLPNRYLRKGFASMRMTAFRVDFPDEPEDDCEQKSGAGRSALACIVQAAIESSVSADDRKRMHESSPLAIVVSVPTASWVTPVKVFFSGEERLILARDGSDRLHDKASFGNDRVAEALTDGKGVLGIAPDRKILPSTLIAAADLSFEIERPTSAVIARAIQLFLDDTSLIKVPAIASSFDLDDLVAAFRKGSSAADIASRLAPKESGAGNSVVPDLETAVEYGAAREWALQLVSDIAAYRAGELSWDDVDSSVVLYSEPGYGKTLFARALAKKLGFSLIASSVAELFSASSGHLDGVIKASRSVFARARMESPCVLLLDELDALPNRATLDSRNRDWWTPVITDFLLQLDSAVSNDRAGIVIIGATNFIHHIDAALLRPGRLEKTIRISLPDATGVENILRFQLRGELAGSDLKQLSLLAEGSTPAELMAIVKSARRAARNERRSLTAADLRSAITPEQSLAPDVLRRIAIHEAGHAVASLVVGFARILSIRVHASADTFAEVKFHRQDFSELETVESIENHIIVLLAGRAGEIIAHGHPSSGAGGADDSDLAKATGFIASMHASTGLAENLSYLSSHEKAFELLRRDAALRATVEHGLQRLNDRTNAILSQNLPALLAIADALVERRYLSGDDVKRLFEQANNRSEPC